jgi:hypothetical protein
VADPLFGATTLSPTSYRCGTPPPTPSEDIQAKRVMDALKAHGVTFRGKTVIPIRFHVIHAGAQGYLPHRRLLAQVELLDRVYAPAGIAFTIADARLHENKAWFRHEAGSDAEIAMKTELGKDTAGSLNIYTAEPRGLSGYATFPWSQRASPGRDGIVIHHASLPDARRRSPDPSLPLDDGMAAVHQIGHWAGGLDHTSPGGCAERGVGAAPSGDACAAPFTPDQYQRIREMVGYYRPELSSATRRSALLAQIRRSVE